MGRSSVTVLVLALTSAACTVVSGVDDMELRTSASPVAPAPSADGGSAFTDPFASGDAATPGTSADIAPPVSAGPATCGSQGSWSACTVPPTVASCSTICAAKGFACVDSCCATDELGDFAAKVGSVYVLASECSLNAITNQATFGLCADPIVLPAGFGELRCCCK
jgi:hypothetical protein